MMKPVFYSIYRRFIKNEETEERELNPDALVKIVTGGSTYDPKLKRYVDCQLGLVTIGEFFEITGIPASVYDPMGVQKAWIDADRYARLIEVVTSEEMKGLVNERKERSASKRQTREKSVPQPSQPRYKEITEEPRHRTDVKPLIRRKSAE